MKTVKPAGPMNKGPQGGVTLIELLTAMAVSAFIVILAGRTFMMGNRQFLQRSVESDRFAALYRMKSWVEGELRKEVSRCGSGNLWLSDSAGEKDLSALAKAHFPAFVSADFHCFEPAADSASLVDWKDGFQPPLIEYKVIVRKGKQDDTLTGSWIK